MPWTFAHPATVLPLRRVCGPGRLSFPALVVGSLSPDFGYHVGLFGLAAHAHTGPGMLAACLPLGWLVLLLMQRLGAPMARLLPEPHRSAALASALPAARLPVVSTSLSLLIGAQTHVAWDAFTHEGRFFVERLAVLRVSLRVLGHEVALFNLLQHGSSVVGVLLLAIAYRRHLQRVAVAPSADSPRCWALLSVLAAAAVILALPFALVDARASGVLNPSIFIAHQVIHSTTAFLTLWVGAALLPRRR